MNTYGFDYSFALSADKVNEILSDNLSGVDMEIPYTTQDPDSGSTITLNCKLAPWQIVRGGQNTLLNFNVPIAEGFLSLEGGAITGSYDLTGVSVEMQVSLGWMGAGDEQQATGSGDVTKLVFLPNDTKDKNNPGYVAAIQVFDPNRNLDTVSKGILQAYMADALISNRDKLQYIFANVNPTPANVGSWLNPKKWLYYYSETPNGPNALCFLCMLSDAAFPAQPAFDASALSSATNSVLLISQPAFFRNVVVPGVKSSMPGGAFSLNCPNDQCAVTNDGDFNVGTVTLTSFTLTVSDDGNGLKTNSGGGGPLKFLFGLADLPGASYSWGDKTNNPLQFSNGMISFKSDPNPILTQDHTIPWLDWVLLVVLGILNVVGLVSMIYDLVNKFDDVVNKVGMGTINDDMQKSVGGTVVNLATLIDWRKDGETFAPTGAGLAGALYVRGNLS
jgi:Clostridium P-47 protein